MNKKLLGAKGIATRTLLGAPGPTTRNKKVTETRNINRIIIELRLIRI